MVGPVAAFRPRQYLVVHQFVIPNKCERSLTIKSARFLSHFVASK